MLMEFLPCYYNPMAKIGKHFHSANKITNFFCGFLYIFYFLFRNGWLYVFS